MNENLVSVTIDGTAFGGWTSAQISRSLEQAAGSFRLTASERFPGQDQPIGVKPGSACVVMIGENRVITGYIDSVASSYDANAHTVTIAGRSKTQDLIDCAALPPWSPILAKTVVEIAGQLAKPYGIDVVSAVGGDLTPIEKVKINPSETVFQVLTRLANLSGVLLTDDPHGRLLITRTGLARSFTRLQVGDNILSGSGTFQHQQRFQEYRVIGQGSKVGDTQISATVRDDGVSRLRVHIVRGEGQLTAQKAEDRARWEAASRSGKASTATYAVQGWRQANQALWEINQLVTIRDPFLTLDGTFLIASVTFSLSARGTITNLEVVPPSAFILKPTQPEPATKDVGVWKELVDEGVTP